MFSFIIVTEADAAAMSALDDPIGSGGIGIGPRIIDNPAADTVAGLLDALGVGTVVGMYGISEADEKLADPRYERWSTLLSAHTAFNVDPADLFAIISPPPDEND
jgi:hypothetical protein